jgi:hypothetical protein
MRTAVLLGAKVVLVLQGEWVGEAGPLTSCSNSVVGYGDFSSES